VILFNSKVLFNFNKASEIDIKLSGESDGSDNCTEITALIRRSNHYNN
jgi:hypothetical protein